MKKTFTPCPDNFGKLTGTITLSNSQTGVSYQLKDGSNNNVQSAQAGTTGSSVTVK